MTSGMIRGAETSPENSVRPPKRRKRASAMPAIVPRMVARVALIRAILSERRAAAMTWSFEKRRQYHSVENPPHTVASRDLLNEKKIMETIGM
jgi:hypothetical protein